MPGVFRLFCPVCNASFAGKGVNPGRTDSCLQTCFNGEFLAIELISKSGLSYRIELKQ